MYGMSLLLRLLSAPMSAFKKGKKARAVKHFGWHIGPSFIPAIPASLLSLFFVLAPVDPSYHAIHFAHMHPDHNNMVNIVKHFAFREDEIHRMLHRS